jgi:hypothetical protein
MARYSLNNRLAGTQQANSASFKTQLVLSAATATLLRGSLIDLSVGADSAPNATDTQIVYDVSRSTTIGTGGTAVTPVPLDNTSSAAGTVGTANLTGEPTITATSSLYAIALNQRSSLRVFFDQGLRWPATNLNGLAIRSLSPVYAGNTLVAAIFDE